MVNPVRSVLVQVEKTHGLAWPDVHRWYIGYFSVIPTKPSTDVPSYLEL